MKGSENKAVFSKLQLVKSALFKKNTDLLQAVLKPDKDYSLEQVKEVIQNFMKGKVV